MLLKRWEKACAVIGGMALAVGLWARLRPDATRRDLIVDTGVCRMPVTVLEPESGKPIGNAAVFHGLSANRTLMVHLGRVLAATGLRTYLVDLPGHGDNTDPFSFPWAEQCAGELLLHVANADPPLSDKTVIVGHSMGGSLAIRLGRSARALATIAISPGPLVPVPPYPDRLRPYNKPERLPDNLLVLVGGLDMPGFERGARALLREARETNPQGHAAELRNIPWATHTGLVLSPRVDGEIKEWLRHVFGEIADARPKINTLSLLLPLGVVLLFPTAVKTTVAFRFPAKPVAASPPDGLPSTTALLTVWTVGAGAVASIAAILGATPYLAIFLALAGPICLALFWLGSHIPEAAVASGRFDLVDQLRKCTFASGIFRRLVVANAGEWYLIGGFLALYVVTGLGWAISRDWGDLWMTGQRWIRFLVLVPFLAPYFLLEEEVLALSHASSDSWNISMSRWRLYLSLRFILWLALLWSVFVMGSKEVLMVLMVFAFAGFTLAQRLAADIVGVRTGSPVAAGFFSAVLAAWFIAAVFSI